MPPAGCITTSASSSMARSRAGPCRRDQASIRPESVTSGRTLDEVAQGRRALRPASRRATGRQSGARKPGERKASVPRRARAAAAFPAWIEPELATLVDAAPERGDWRYEVKYDGYRVLVRAHRDQVKIFTRNQQDWTERFPRIAAELARLELEATWLDGEVCALIKDGRSSFSVLQRALSGEAKQQPVLIAFDLPYARGNDLRNEPLSVRQAKLQELLGKSGRRSLLKLSESLSGSGEVIRAKACKLGLEGVIGKRADSAYVGRRTRDWSKLKCRQRQEMIIAGYTSGTGMREALGSLILAVREPGGALRYAGRVGTGFNDAMLRRLVKALAPLRREEPTVEGAPRRVSGHMIHWVRPELVAEVSFAEWTHEGIVRQASFEGLREDKKAADVTRETPQATPSDVSKAVPASSRSIKHATVIAGVKVSHPDRMLFSDLGITKLDIARYYERVAPIMLKYAGGRPLALLRCPDGPDGACFFQKHAVAGRIPGVDMVKIREGGGVHQYV